MKYLNPKADLTFKRVFGEHPDLVMSLLNALLPLDPEQEITEINEHTREAPAELLANPEVNKALTELQESAFSNAQLLGYEKFWDIISLEKNTLQQCRTQRISERIRKRVG